MDFIWGGWMSRISKTLGENYRKGLERPLGGGWLKGREAEGYWKYRNRGNSLTKSFTINFFLFLMQWSHQPHPSCRGRCSGCGPRREFDPAQARTCLHFQTCTISNYYIDIYDLSKSMYSYYAILSGHQTRN